MLDLLSKHKTTTRTTTCPLHLVRGTCTLVMPDHQNESTLALLCELSAIMYFNNEIRKSIRDSDFVEFFDSQLQVILKMTPVRF